MKGKYLNSTRLILTVLLSAASLNLLFAQNSPTSPALDFNTFVSHNFKAQSSEMEGPLAVGGNLEIAGDYNVSAHHVGTYTNQGKFIALAVQGHVNYISGNQFRILSQGYANIANCGTAKVWYQDQNGAYPPIKITKDQNPNSTPKIDFSQNALNWGVSGTNNPICQSPNIDFNSAFISLKNNALTMSNFTDNAVLKTANGDLLSRSSLPNQVYVHLQNNMNVLNITATELNRIDVLTFSGSLPDANHYLIINVDAQASAGVVNWKVYNTAGHNGFASCKYILYNFYNTNQLTININSSSIEGTLFAPYADIIKFNNSNIQGQVIAKSYTQNDGGEIHYAKFEPTLPVVTPVSPQAIFGIDNVGQCLANNLFQFTDQSTAATNLTYSWDFGDNQNSTLANPTHTYLQAGSYTVTLTVNDGSQTDQSSQTIQVYTMPTAGITSNNAPQFLTGNSFNFDVSAPQALDQYAWDFDNNTYSNQANNTITYSQAGVYNVKLVVSSANSCKDSITEQVTVLSDQVQSGNNGGLESESLGGIISERDFLRKKNSIDTRVDYLKFSDFVPNEIKSIGGVQTLEQMMPKFLEAGDQMKVTSPKDLINLTAAKEVYSVDYIRNNRAIGVVLGIKTLDKAYSHTKSICDRFKGSSLLKLDTVTIKGYQFIQFTLQREIGVIEYAIAFIVGDKKGRDHYKLQSNWLISEYQKDETVYNFQVWTVSPYHTQKLVHDLLTNLESHQNMIQVGSSDVPQTYIISGKRNLENLDIEIENKTSQQAVKFILEERINEQAGVAHKTYEYQIAANSKSKVSIDIKDGYEYQVSYFIDNKLGDEVYLADGNWGLDYDASLTTIKEFSITNNANRVYSSDQYPLYRNVALLASNQDYVSIYKTISAGTVATDLSAFKSLQFYAAGSGNLEIKLTKESISEWKNQFSFNFPLSEKGRVYEIKLSDFKNANNQAITLQDIETIVFTLTTEKGVPTDLKLQLKDVSFSTKDSKSLAEIHSKELTTYPNPTSGNVNFQFMSLKDQNLKIKLSDMMGRVYFEHAIDANFGSNEVAIQANGLTGVFLLTIEGENTVYESSKLMFE